MDDCMKTPPLFKMPKFKPPTKKQIKDMEEKNPMNRIMKNIPDILDKIMNKPPKIHIELDVSPNQLTEIAKLVKTFKNDFKLDLD